MRNTILLVGAAMIAAPSMAQEAAPAAAPATTASTAAAPNVTAGATVSDASGASVGTIASVSGGNATIDTGTVKAAVPVTSFAAGANGLVFGMTKAELEAAANKAKAPAQVAVGASVVGPQGNSVGKVAEVNGDLVTVQTPTTKVQLPKNAFAAAADGGVMIGLTQDQLEAAAKAASKPS